MTKNFIVICPHCKDFIEIISINCGIFRHGYLKKNLTQINPHLPKNECDRLFNEGLIYCCGKPFRVVKKNNSNEYEAIICDYI